MTHEIDQSSYHWIAKALEPLDPETDYELIYRLTSCYASSDFMNNLVYSLTFPNFIVTPQGAEAVWRSDGGKVVGAATARVEETENTNMTWWYYGPSDPRCRKAIDKINQRHFGLAKKYPGNFSHNEDFVYTTAFSAILMHRLRLRLGLPGISEKEKIASHHFWRDMTPLFLKETGEPVTGYPDDFDGCMRYCEAFENRPREPDPRTRYIGLAIFEHFAFRYFPPGLRWLGRSFPIALSLPSTLKAMKIEPVNPIVGAFVVFVVRTIMIIGSFLPDAKVSFPVQLEQMDEAHARARTDNIKKIDKAYAPYIRAKLSGPGCPFAHKMD